MLGLGLGINRANQQKTREALARSAGAVLYLDSRKATGWSPGSNSPLTNPKDLSGNGNDATLVNFAGTTSSGYATIALPNGNTMPFIKPDGVDDLGTMVNTPSMDIVGTEDFAICGCFMTGATFQNGYLICKNLDTSITNQYAVNVYSDGRLAIYINGSEITLAGINSITVNKIFYIIITRIGGRLKCLLNGIEIYNQANSVSIVTSPNLRLFARSTNAGGTAHFSYFNNYLAYLAVFRGTKCTEANINRFCENAARDYVSWSTTDKIYGIYHVHSTDTMTRIESAEGKVNV